MIASGGSSILALERLHALGAKLEKVRLIGFIAAKEGIARIKREFPQVSISVVVIDPELDSRKFIVPGLGDFGDRYFGTE